MNIRNLSCVFFACMVFATSHAMADCRDLGHLVGTWAVDLRPTPDSEPYLQTFTIDAVEDNRFSGSFYGTSFDGGIINANWETIHFAFTTEDGRTIYHHSGSVDGQEMTGRTHAPGRDTLFIWSATKTE